MKLLVKLLNENAKTPTRSEGNAGYDLYCSEAIIIPPLKRAIIKTGVSMSIPVGYVGLIKDRSGVAYKSGGHCIAGVIDSNYRGEVGIVMLNTDTEKEISFNVGDRPAQILFIEHARFPIEIVESLDETDRGVKGYGSSGK